MNVTEQFIDLLFACDNRIDGRTLEKARSCLLDYLGVTYAGAKENRKMLSETGTNAGRCTIIGAGKKTDVLTAAFLNGYNAHTVELDDGHRFGAIHLGAAIISAILTVAQDKYANGIEIPVQAVLRGIIVGYEAAVRCGISMQPGHKKRGYHTSGTCGTIGAAVGVGFMLGYDRKQMMSTVAGAATGAAGFLEIQEDASEMKPYNLGHAAMSGVMAALVGAARPCPPNDILGGARGILRVMTDTFSEEKLLARTDVPEIERIYVKPYAACRHCHPAIEAALALREQYGIPPEAIDHINVYTYAVAVRGHDHTEVQGAQSAKLSMPFSIAAAYCTGDGGMDAFSPQRLQDAGILELARKVSVVPEEVFTKLTPEKRASEVQIVSAGTAYVKRVDYAKGDPENPMTEKEIRAKFAGLMQWVGREAEGSRILSVFEKNEMELADLLNQL